MVETKKNILVVEDDKLLASIFKMYIQNLGHNLVGIASSANDSLEKCKELTPDLVLMDINLNGDIDGISATKMIHETSDIPVVYITGETSESTLERALGTNAYGYLVKPITQKPLEENIQFAFQKHNQDRNLSLSDKRIITMVSKSTKAIILVNNEIVRIINPVAMNFFKIRHYHQIIDHPLITLIEENSREKILKTMIEEKDELKKHENIQINCIDFNQKIVPSLISLNSINFENQFVIQIVFSKSDL